MASGWILSPSQLCKLKQDVIHLVQSSERRCVDLSSFIGKYKDFYGVELLDQYPSLRSWRLLDVMKELRDVISLIEERSSVYIVCNPTFLPSPPLPFAGVSLRLNAKLMLKIFVWCTLSLKLIEKQFPRLNSQFTPLRIMAGCFVLYLLYSWIDPLSVVNFDKATEFLQLFSACTKLLLFCECSRLTFA